MLQLLARTRTEPLARPPPDPRSDLHRRASSRRMSATARDLGNTNPLRSTIVPTRIDILPQKKACTAACNPHRSPLTLLDHLEPKR